MSSQKFPLKNAIAQSDLDMNGHSILNLAGGFLPSPTLRGINKEVWITLRTDGLAGSGTKEDPFDGSTRAKFDTLMAGLTLSNISIILGPGTFVTRGSLAWTIGTKFYLKGAGREITTLQFDATYTPTAAQQIGLIAMASNSVDGNGIEISDVTLDCNSQNVSGAMANSVKNFKIFGAYIYGSYNVFRNVRLLNQYGSRINNLECSGIGIEGIVATAANANLAVNCIALTPRGDYNNGFLIGANPNGAKTPNGYGNTILHCTAIGYTAAYPGQAVGFSASSVIDSTADGCQIGMRWEPTTNVKILGNRVMNSDRACIAIEDGGGANNILIQGNTFEIRRDNADSFNTGVFIADEFGVSNSNLVVDNNTFLIKSGSGSGTCTSIASSPTLGLGYSFTNNKFQTGMSFGAGGIPVDSYRRGNRYLNGDPIPGLYDSNEQSVSFIPVAIGWYRVVSGVNAMGGSIVLSDSYGGNADEVAVHYDVGGYGTSVNLVQVRSLSFSGRNVDQIRGSSTGAGTYLDIHVAVSSSTEKVKITIGGGDINGTIVSAPVTGATAGSDLSKVLNFANGLVGTNVQATSILTLGDHSVNQSADPTDKQVLYYDSGDSSWKPGTVSTISGTSLLKAANNLSDVAAAATARNNILPSQVSNSGKALVTDGTNVAWTTIAGSGSFTSFAFTDANGFHGVVANSTTAPALTLKLGDVSDPTKAGAFDLSNITAGNTRTINVPDANSTTAQTKGAVANNFLTAMSTQGVFSAAQPAVANISDFNASVAPAFVGLVDGATITLTAVATTAIQNTTVTLAGNRTLAFSGVVNGMSGILIVKQDGTGSRTLALPATSKVVNGGGGAIVLSTAASAIDILGWVKDGSNIFWTVLSNFS